MGHIIASAEYAAAKAGVIALTGKLAVELVPKIIVVAPSFVETDMIKDMLKDPEAKGRIE